MLKNELNSEAILRLFVSIVLLICKLFVGFVLTNSFIPYHILSPFFCVLQRSFWSRSLLFLERVRIRLQYFLNLLWRSDFDLLSLTQQNLLYNVVLILIDLSIPFVIQGLLIFFCFLDIYFKGACLSKMLLIFLRNCSNEWFASWRWMSRVYSQPTLQIIFEIILNKGFKAPC